MMSDEGLEAAADSLYQDNMTLLDQIQELTNKTVKHCSTCRSWGSRSNETGRIRTCDKHTHSYTNSADVPDDGVVIEFEEGYGMLTGPEFGCVGWELKGEER